MENQDVRFILGSGYIGLYTYTYMTLYIDNHITFYRKSAGCFIILRKIFSNSSSIY